CAVRSRHRRLQPDGVARDAAVRRLPSRRQLRRRVADVRQLPPRRGAAGQAAGPSRADRLRQLPQPLGVDPGHATRSAIDMPVPDAAIIQPAERSATDVDLRLTLSTFLYRETGGDAPAIADQGATLQNASPVQRTFGDLRSELSAGGFALDARI